MFIKTIRNSRSTRSSFCQYLARSSLLRQFFAPTYPAKSPPSDSTSCSPCVASPLETRALGCGLHYGGSTPSAVDLEG